MKWFRTSLYNDDDRTSLFAVIEIRAASVSVAEDILEEVAQGKRYFVYDNMEPCTEADE